jgi:hypothetical protein
MDWTNLGEGEIFHTYPDGPWDTPSLLYNAYRVIPGGKPQCAVNTHHHIVQKLKKE